MFQRLVTAILLLAIAVGTFNLIHARIIHAEVKQEFDRLVAKVGRLEITDPKKFHVVPIETNEPFHYAWRVIHRRVCRFTKELNTSQAGRVHRHLQGNRVNQSLGLVFDLKVMRSKSMSKADQVLLQAVIITKNSLSF